MVLRAADTYAAEELKSYTLDLMGDNLGGVLDELLCLEEGGIAEEMGDALLSEIGRKREIKRESQEDQDDEERERGDDDRCEGGQEGKEENENEEQALGGIETAMVDTEVKADEEWKWWGCDYYNYIEIDAYATFNPSPRSNPSPVPEEQDSLSPTREDSESTRDESTRIVLIDGDQEREDENGLRQEDREEESGETGDVALEIPLQPEPTETPLKPKDDIEAFYGIAIENQGKKGKKKDKGKVKKMSSLASFSEDKRSSGSLVITPTNQVEMSPSMVGGMSASWGSLPSLSNTPSLSSIQAMEAAHLGAEASKPQSPLRSPTKTWVESSRSIVTAVPVESPLHGRSTSNRDMLGSLGIKDMKDFGLEEARVLEGQGGSHVIPAVKGSLSEFSMASKATKRAKESQKDRKKRLQKDADMEAVHSIYQFINLSIYQFINLSIEL